MSRMFNALSMQFKKQVAEGAGAVAFDGVKCYMPKATFYGACQQDGTPTPESPVPVLCNNSKWALKDADGVTISTVDLSLLPDGGLYGIGSVRDEWDCVSGDGVRRVGKVDLGTLNWTRFTTVGSHAFFQDTVKSRVYGGKTRFISNGLIIAIHSSSRNGFTRAEFADDAPDNSIGALYTNNDVVIRDDTYTSQSTFKNAMSGIMLYYELATPVPFHATPQPLIQANGLNTLQQIGGDIADTDVSVEYVKHS